VGTGTTAAYQLGSALGNHVVRRGAGEDLVGPGQAPQTILNRRIGRNRRFATQQLPLPAIKSVGKACGATVNDVCLAILGGGLRRFLGEAGELPEKPLIAFVPVNVRPKDDPGGGNSVGAILATMGTDIDDPAERLRAVAASTRAAKTQLEGMSQPAMIAYGAAILSPLVLQTTLAYTGLPSPLPLTFNVTVSNVPGPKRDCWFRGSRLEAMHPVSIPIHGAGLNVTMMSYADTLNFGFVGDRDAVPHLQRLAVYTGDAFTALRAALGH
jgi:WS/DGAT/MGAT family acyltransferase